MSEEHGESAQRAPLAEGELWHGLAGWGDLRWALVDLTAIVEAVRLRRDYSPIAATALGRVLAGAALLHRLAVKTPSRLLLEVRGDGPLGQVVAEADDLGNLRGAVSAPQVVLPDEPDGRLAVGRAVGKGRLRVLREHSGGASYHSQVELVSGEIGLDLAHYLEQSEQTQSAVVVGVLARPQGILAAGGLIVEVMPGGREEPISTLERNLAVLGSFSRLLADGGPRRVLDEAFAGLDREELDHRTLAYRCRCSRARLAKQLTSIARQDAAALFGTEDTLTAECSFCGEVYLYEREELLAGVN